MPTSLDTFLVTCNGIGAIGIDYVDVGVEPDEDIVYAFVTFRPRLPAGTVIWCPGLTPPRGIQLDDVKGRFSPEDGKLRTIIAGPTNEKQRISITGDPTGGTFTLTYAGQTTAAIPYNATPADVDAALEALPNIGAGNVFTSGVTVNEKQTVTITGSPTGGTFTLTYDGETTAPISRNATPSLVQAALQLLPSIGNLGCSVTGPTGGPFVVEFTGALAGQNITPMTSTTRNETQLITVTGTPTGGDFMLTYSGQTTTAIAYNASAATIQTALEALSNIAPGDVAVSGADGGPWSVEFTGTLALTNVATLQPVTRDEVQTVTITGSPTGGTFTLTYDGQTTVTISRTAVASTVRTALEGLSNIAPGDVTVTGTAGAWTVTFKNTLGKLNVPQMTAADTFTPSGDIVINTTTQGVGVIGGTVTVATTVEAVFLVGGTTPSVSITTTVPGSTGTPYTVSFTGDLAATDVAALTASGAGLTPSGGVTIETLTIGGSDLGVRLVANTALLGPLPELIYDVLFEVPESDRELLPFAFSAPTTAGATVDLSTVARLPYRTE